MNETKPDYTGITPPRQMIVYPYPPVIEIDGELYETLDYMTLVKLVYTLRNRVNELENANNIYFGFNDGGKK
ncbi:MAG: hypothetical protein WC107_05775 [Patescibacteria group bacterium]|jgi:hypothetical protein